MERNHEPTRDGRRQGRTFAFEQGTGYLLARVGSLARRRWSDMLAEYDLTSHHYGVLMALDEVGPTGQKRLSELIGVDARNVVPIVDGLVERGLLRREVDAHDRRRRVLTLTPVGQALIRKLTRAVAVVEERFLRPLDPTARTRLHRSLVALLDADGS